MSFKVKSFLLSLVFCTLLYTLMFIHFSSERHFLYTVFPDGGARILLCLGFGLVASFLTSAGVFLFSKNVKGQNAVMEEFETNGISDRYIYLLQTEVNKGVNKPMTQFQLNYILQLADAYIMKGNPNAAINTLGLFGPVQTQKLMSPKAPMGESNRIKYYDLQMSISEQLHSPDRANNIMQEAMPVLMKYRGKGGSIDLVICETLCIYYLLIGRYDEALKSVEFCDKYDNKHARFLNNVQRVRIYSYLGDTNAAHQYYSAAASMVEKPSQRDIMAYLNNVYLHNA